MKTLNNQEKAKELVSRYKLGTSISQFVNDVMYDAIVDMAQWKDEQYLENAEEDAKSYVDGVAKANPDLSASILNLLETAYIAGRNRIK